MKYWNSAFNAQFGVIIVVVHVGVVKIYVAPVEATRKKERRVKIGWNSVWHKKWCISEFLPPWRLMYFFTCFWKISAGFGPNSVYRCLVFLTVRKTLLVQRVHKNMKFVDVLLVLPVEL
jgi:hypothetical protein